MGLYGAATYAAPATYPVTQQAYMPMQSSIVEHSAGLGGPQVYLPPVMATVAPTSYLEERAAPVEAVAAPVAFTGQTYVSPELGASMPPQQTAVSYAPPAYNPSPGPVTALSYTPLPTAPGPYVAPSYSPLPTGSFTPAVIEGVPPGSAAVAPGAYGAPVQVLVSGHPQPQSGSFVAQPPRAPPGKLTEGIPDPNSVEVQKAAYSKSIEAQLKQETGLLAQRNQAQKQMLAQSVQQQKAQYNLQMDQFLQQQSMAVDQQANAEMMALQEAAMAQKMALEQQAAGLTLEYQQKKAQEEMLQREYHIQKQYWDAEQKLVAQHKQEQERLARNAPGPEVAQLARGGIQPGGMLPGGLPPGMPPLAVSGPQMPQMIQQVSMSAVPPPAVYAMPPATYTQQQL